MKFGILGNTKSHNAENVLNNLINFLIQKKIDFFIDKNLDVLLEKDSLKKYSYSQSTLLKRADLIISIGGDGTFLNTARIVGKKNIPILGVNLGSLGFMAEVSPDEIDNFIVDIIQNKFKVDELCLLTTKHKKKKIFNSLNDIVIDKSNSVRMIDIEIFCNKEKVIRFVGDGIIVSTPTGSTGYSMSAGGSIISPLSKVFIVTPICPHTLNFRPIIIPDDKIIDIHVYGQREFRVTSDGYLTNVYKSPDSLNKTYFQTLNSKLLWGADKRRYSKRKDYN